MTKLASTVLAVGLVLAACGNDSAQSVDAEGPGGTGDGPGLAAACLAEDPDCADIGVPNGPDQPPADGDEPVSSPPREPGEPGEPTEPQPRVVEPTGDAAQVRASGWDELQATDDPRVYLVTFWGGVEPCHVVDRVEVTETADDVTIALFVGSDPDAQGQACIELAEYLAVEVTLVEPVGERTVVDPTD